MLDNGDDFNRAVKASEEYKKMVAGTLEEGKKFDDGKLRYDLLDPECVEGLVKILTFGAKKYSPNNWRGLANNGGRDRCYAALQRHMAEYRKGFKIDNETGKSHLYHAACNLYFLDYFDRMNGVEPCTLTK